MKLLLSLIFGFFINSESFAQKTNQSFLVNVGERGISVVSPKDKEDIATIVVTNETFDKIVSEIRSGEKTIKRFVLEPSGSKGAVFTLTVNVKEAQTLYYVSIAPPFQETPLIFSKEKYEIP